jgi:hypothetical protein
MTEPIGDALRQLAEQARPARIPSDLWRQGRRRIRRRRLVTVAGGALAVVALSMAVALVGGTGRPLRPAVPSPLVPSTVDSLLPFTRTVLDAPPGPASLLISGVGSFSGSDVFEGYEGHTAVVGSTYRLVRTVGDVNAGDRLLLSPDGRFVAGGQMVEGADPVTEGTALVDLTTGTVRTIPGGAPLAWSPDGKHLLVTTSPTDPRSGWAVLLLDLANGRTTDLFATGAPPRGGSFAFSPDGDRLAVQAGTELDLYDLATRQRTTVPLGPDQMLAGVGAWRPDGRIALWQRTPQDGPDPYALRLLLVEPSAGAIDQPAFDPVGGLGAWLLGWQSDGTAVVETFHGVVVGPAADPIDFARSAGVSGLHPGGGRSELVRLPGDATRVDVARDRLDSFGGPRPSRYGDWVSTHILELLLLGLFTAGTATLVGWYRRRPARRHPRPHLNFGRS